MNQKAGQKFTLSVGIPAYNEEKNILQLLESLTGQRGDAFVLEKIMVISDGSTDGTRRLVKNYAAANPLVSFAADGERKGQAARLNELYRNNSSDILVTLDADCRLKDEWVLEELARPFLEKGVGLVGGNDQPNKPENFFERITVVSINLWYETRRTINNGASVYNHHGCVSALSKELCQKIKIPAGVAAADTFLFFRALELGFAFRYAAHAVVYYHAPNNWKDYAAQTMRFWKSKQQISGIFGPWIDKLRVVPPANKFRALFKVFFSEPAFLPLALLLRLRLKFFRPQSPNPDAVWARINSTKREFKNTI